MGITRSPSNNIDYALLPYFGWVGSQFPFVPPGTADIIISGATTWNDAAGYKQVNVLTINAGQTLRINKSPFYIFCNELNFGDTSSIIDASGPAGGATPTDQTGFAKGGYGAAGEAQGGAGGGMLFIIAGRVTGAAGVIKANGGNGYNSASGTGLRGGQGALSPNVNLSTAEQFSGIYTLLLGNGGGYSGTSQKAIGGGSGGSGGGAAAGGGSGIGGGGGYTSTTNAGSQPVITPTPKHLVDLASLGCLGGGGGAAVCNNGGGGGGGGCVIIWAKSYAANPTLQANGGTAAGTHGNGAAGVTYQITL